MSTLRVRHDRGWVSLRDRPRGPNGRGLCRLCGAEVPKGKLTFCGVACVYRWKLQTQPAFVRQEVFKRDKGVCAACGLDTMYGVLRPRARGTGRLWQADHVVPVAEGGGLCGLDNYQTLCRTCHTEKTAAQTARKRERNERTT